MKSRWIYTIILALVIVGFVIWLVSMQIEEFELQKDPKLPELKALLNPMFEKKNFNNPLLQELNKGNVLDKISLYKGEKSYTINKSKVYLCLRDENGEYYSNNMLLFVFLHELAHVICDEIGHTKRFQEIFDALLDEASNMGIYDPDIPVVRNYCNSDEDNDEH